MEKISAACAMDWSVELDKGLRSKKPGQPIEAILQIGPKLQQWSREPIVTMAISNMYNLVPGEDRLFANAILLRLADAFKSGDKHTRICILKGFLLELKHRNKKGAKYNGLLTKKRVPNYIELLKRVKMVYDTGDVESRALALRLLGCWADFAKDSTEIRYMILSSLESCHVLEVKASLFAASCFCELSEDFACIILETLINMVTSSKTPSDVKLVAARSFAKMGCSSSIASRAYKTGKKLLLDSSREEFVIEILSSLSKLACKSMLLIHEQVDLLLSFLNGESSLSIPGVTLRCLRILLAGGVCCFPIHMNGLKTLFHMLDNTELPLNLKCEALRILRKIFSCTLPNMPHMDMTEFVKLVLIVEKVVHSSITSKRYLALGLLVDISCNLKVTTEQGDWCYSPEQVSITCMLSRESSLDVALVSSENGLTSLPWRVALFVIDQITLLVKQVDIGSAQLSTCSDTALEVKQSCYSLLNLIMRLLEQYPMLGLMVLDRIKDPIEALVNMSDSFNIDTACTCGEVSGMDLDTEITSPICRFMGYKGKDHTPIASELILCICRFAGACLELLDEAGAITSQVIHRVKLLVEPIQNSGFLNDKMCVISTLFHSRLMWRQCGNETINATQNVDKGTNELKVGADLTICYINFGVDLEWLTLDFTKKMILGKQFWAAYKTGKYAACQGAWFVATFTFRQLVERVQSDLYHSWLHSLALLAGGESEIQLLLFPKLAIHLISGLQRNPHDGNYCTTVLGDVGQGISGMADLQDCGEKLAVAYRRVCSSEETLAAADTLAQPFYFQRWFLSLRAKVIEIVIDIIELLNSGTEETVGTSLPVYVHYMHSSVYYFTFISCRLKKLAREFDLLATSFMDMDCRSFRTISRHALNCSLLAFCTAFVLYFTSLPAYNNVMNQSVENSGKILYSKLVQDLAERLWYIDSKTSTDLQQFFTVTRDLSSPVQSRTQIHSCGHRERETLMVSSFAVAGLFRMQEEAKTAKCEEDLCRLFKAGFELLAEEVRKWMYIPFQTPKYFFRVRPSIGAEIFVFNADTRNSNEISISQGFQLSLNLCIQLKNTSSNVLLQLSKMYCIIAARPSDRVPNKNPENKGQEETECRGPKKTDEIVVLNEILLSHMTGKMQHCEVGGDGGFVKACVSLECNERGQGFSSCLLDVSAFSEGSYQIMWHSCCIDRKGCYWSLVSLNDGPVFSVKKPSEGTI